MIRIGLGISNQSSGTSGGWFNLSDGTLTGTSNGAGNVSNMSAEADGSV